MTQERMSPEGYNKEEEYFHRKNQELIEQTRKKLDADRAAARQRGQSQSHWMVCPKCGAKLKETDLAGVKVDQCGGCGGIFLDKGEVALLIKGRQPNAITEELKGLLKEIEPF
jgi:Zn-finger nucleic acid-binding protein